MKSIMKQNPPVIDLHCDLLSYLRDNQDADPFISGEIGCSFPSLIEGNVKLQVMAIYTSTKKGSTDLALQQSLIFKDLASNYTSEVQSITRIEDLEPMLESSKTGIVASIENASGFCEEDEPLKTGFGKLEKIIENVERVLYISLTHHGENRFGGGNYSKPGLKEDGKVLLDYLDGRKIAVDLSHTSDALANDILEHLDQKNLDIPIMASHSNYRPIWDHPRNLPDHLAKEIIRRKGLIGSNFLRAFLNDKDPHALYNHIDYGLGLGAGDAISFGADFFHTGSHPDQSRRPFYHLGQDDSSCYPSILKIVGQRNTPELVEKMSHRNALDFIGRIWE